MYKHYSYFRRNESLTVTDAYNLLFEKGIRANSPDEELQSIIDLFSHCIDVQQIKNKISNTLNPVGNNFFFNCLIMCYDLKALLM